MVQVTILEEINMENSNTNQTHSGSGDNVAGDKVTITVEPSEFLALLKREIQLQSGNSEILKKVSLETDVAGAIKPDCDKCNNHRFIKITSQSFFGELTKVIECPNCK